MDYRYTSEADMPVNVNITLNEIQTLLDILGPIAKSEDHEERYRAASLWAQLTEIQKRSVKQANQHIGYLAKTLSE